jgi:pyruvate,water dikinase
MNYIFRFDNTTSTSIFGGKANRLIEMVQQGFQVPFGGVLHAKAFDLFLNENTTLNNAIQSLISSDSVANYEWVESEINSSIFPSSIEIELRQFYDLMNEKGIKSLAVRSSGTLEDGANSSFAGQFESYLNILSFESLKLSIIKCWTSLFGKKVITYCKNNAINIKEFAMCVVIQEQIRSDFSGVLFTVNPLTGHDKEMVVEAVSGVGEALVQGNSIPDMYRYNWYDETIEIARFGKQEQLLFAEEAVEGLSWRTLHTQNQLLTETQIIELCAKCLDIQQFYGEPLDIEWAIFNNVVYILQARPLTAIHFKVEYEWSTADLKDGGISSSITTPMMFSLYEYVFENTIHAFLSSIHVLPKQKFNKWFNWWFGYSYWNMLATKEGVKQVPGFNERNFDKSLGIEPDYEGDGFVTKYTLKSIFKGIQILIASKKSIAKRAAICKNDIQTTRLYFEKIENLYKTEISLESLMEFFKPMILNHYLQIEGSYFYTIYDNSNAATFCQEAIEKANKKREHKINYLNLVAGLSNLSHMRPTYELWDLSELIKKNDSATTFYAKHDPNSLIELIKTNQDFPNKTELLQYIEKYKYHSLRELDIMVANWDEDLKQPIELLLSFIKNTTIHNPKLATKTLNECYIQEKKKLDSRALNKQLAMHRHLLWWREEMRDYSSKMYYHIRKMLLIIGRKMAEEGLLNEVNDVFFLKFEELFDYTNSKDKVKYLTRIEKNKIFYRSFKNFRNPNEIWQHKDFTKTTESIKSGTSTLVGIAGAHGYVKGKAMVIESIFDAESIREGDILVTKFTDPSWTIYFARISGLVTESGGMLSHGAVVSREYGIPAVLGVKNSTKIIKSGDTIEIDGDSGIVNILKHD